MNLPTPRTATDELLTALVLEIRGLREDLRAQNAPPSEAESGKQAGEIELKEPKRQSTRKKDNDGQD